VGAGFLMNVLGFNVIIHLCIHLNECTAVCMLSAGSTWNEQVESVAGRWHSRQRVDRSQHRYLRD
jgi:hypothetical protein